ncbi:MAG: hypothetical protein MJZ05_02005 [Fibrobacter sp.]|nr:hypothetical protein [Fibrobacter sp.]
MVDSILFDYKDVPATLLARVFLGVTWRNFALRRSHALEQVVFLPAIQQHQPDG